MELEKAIEVLTDYKMESAFEATPDFEDALKLGIEALVRIRYQRQKPTVPHKTPLPSETKE